MAKTPEEKADELAAAVASGKTVRAAALSLGLAERTAYRWAAAPTWDARVRKAREKMFGGAVNRLASLANKAVETLGDLCGSEHKPEIRLAASRAILADFINARSAIELLDRLESLEERAAEVRHGRNW